MVRLHPTPPSLVSGITPEHVCRAHASIVIDSCRFIPCSLTHQCSPTDTTCVCACVRVCKTHQTTDALLSRQPCQSTATQKAHAFHPALRGTIRSPARSSNRQVHHPPPLPSQAASVAQQSVVIFENLHCCERAALSVSRGAAYCLASARHRASELCIAVGSASTKHSSVDVSARLGCPNPVSPR